MTAPITRGERAPLPDILRGLAIGGILLVNLQNFAGYVPWEQSGLDAAVQAVIDVIANGKFISIFAVLFGAGAALFVQRAGAARFVRRLLALLLIGVLHGTLIWAGDIIANYAVVGFVLLPLLLLPGRAQFVAMLVAFAYASALLWLMLLHAPPFPVSPDLAGVNTVYATGTYAEILPHRAEDFLGNLIANVDFFGGWFGAPWLLGLFLLGANLARGGVLYHPERHRRALWVVAALGFALGAVLNAQFVRVNPVGLYDAQLQAIAWRFTGGLAFALAYGALVALLVVHGRAGWLRPFALVGRLALSNYLLGSVLMTLLFNAYGLGLYGRVGASPSLLIALVVFALQVLLSGWYLRRFRVGPAEWVLRRLTYGRKAEA